LASGPDCAGARWPAPSGATCCGRPTRSSSAARSRTASPSRLAIQYLKAECARQGFPTRGLILGRSVFSGKLADAAAKAWDRENERRAVERRPPLQRITLQECRHTYASMLMAARYTSIEIMVNMGHSDLKATEQYLKALPQPNELNEADRLHNYEDGFAETPAPTSAAADHGFSV
jgi:integrase